MKVKEKIIFYSALVSILFLSMLIKIGSWEVTNGLSEKVILRSFISGTISLIGILIITKIYYIYIAEQNKGYVLNALEKKGSKLFLIGLVSGGTLFFAVFISVYLGGGIVKREIIYGQEDLIIIGLFIFAATVVNAAWEEYTFRGAIFISLARKIGEKKTAIGMGIVFGLAHFFNPKWTPEAILSVALAGILICFSMLIFRNIAFPIGIHVGWNFTQSLLTSSKLNKIQWSDNTRLSGGKYGLEASWPGIIITGIAALLLVYYYKKKAHHLASPLPVDRQSGESAEGA